MDIVETWLNDSYVCTLILDSRSHTPNEIKTFLENLDYELEDRVADLKDDLIEYLFLKDGKLVKMYVDFGTFQITLFKSNEIV